MLQFKDGMDEELIITIARDILRGLDYLHRHELQHRDLKVRCRPPGPLQSACNTALCPSPARKLPVRDAYACSMHARAVQTDNLLVDESGRVLLADFGATAQLERQDYAPELVMPRPGGSSPSASDSDRDSSVHSSCGDLAPQVGPLCCLVSKAGPLVCRLRSIRE